MLVVITGGGGFVGQALAARLLLRGQLTTPSGDQGLIDRLVLADVAHPSKTWTDPRIESVTGNVSDPAFVTSIIDRDDVGVFHLAAMLSGVSEVDFDGALRVNLHGTLAVLDACRERASVPRVVVTGSIAAFGGEAVHGTVTDTTKLTPDTTYGTIKAACELLINDYTRKGFLDGRCGRLPTVIVRPGSPVGGAWGWVSGIVRETLNDLEMTVPVPLATRVLVSGHRRVVDNLIRLYEAPSALIGSDRAINMPALTVSAQEMLDALVRVTQASLAGVHVEPDPDVAALFDAWVQRIAFDRGSMLGMAPDESIDAIIRNYVADYLHDGIR